MTKHKLEKSLLTEQQFNQPVNLKKEKLDQSLDKIFSYRQIIGLYILRNRIQAFFLNNQSIKSLNQLVGDNIDQPSQFSRQLQKQYLFRQPEKNLIFLLKEDINNWLLKNNPKHKLWGQQLRDWQIKGIKKVNKFFQTRIKQLDYHENYYIIKQIKKINQYLNQVVDRVKESKDVAKKNKFVKILNLLDEYFCKEGYHLSLPVVSNLFKQLSKHRYFEQDKSKYSLTLQLERLKLAKEKALLTPKEIHQRLHRLMILFAQQQDGLANVATNIESLLQGNKQACFREIWQIVEQGDKQYHFSKEQNTQFYKKIYLLLQRRQIVKVYVDDYRQRFVNQWQEHFFEDMFGFQPKGQMTIVVGTVSLNIVCNNQNDIQRIHDLIVKRKKIDCLKSTTGIFYERDNLLPRLNGIEIVNGSLLVDEEEFKNTIIHEEQHLLWSKIYGLEMHLLNNKQENDFDLKKQINNLFNKTKNEDKLLEIIGLFSKQIVTQLAEEDRIKMRNEILAYYKGGYHMQKGQFKSEELKKLLLEDADYDYLIDQEDKINNYKQMVIKEAIKLNPKIEIKLLGQVIDQGIKKGNIEYHQLCKRYLDLDLKALDKLDLFYPSKRNKVTTLLSFNPNWQLLARRLSEFDDELLAD